MFKDRFSIFLCVVVLSLMHFQAHAQVDSEQPLLRYTETPSPVLYQELNKATALIRDQSDLQAYLESPLSRKNPISQLTSEQRQRFVDGLVFGPRGLASFETGVLQNMSPVDAYAILALFGFQHALVHIDFQSQLDAFDKEIKLATDQINRCGDGSNAALCDDLLDVHVCSGGDCHPSRSSVCSPSSCD